MITPENIELHLQYIARLVGYARIAARNGYQGTFAMSAGAARRQAQGLLAALEIYEQQGMMSDDPTDA